MGGRRRRLITESERRQAITLINKACRNGAHKYKACEILSFSMRALQRWVSQKDAIDRRKGAKKKVHNKLAQAEIDSLLAVANSPEYRDLPASKIVPRLADAGKHIALECTLYCYLKYEKQTQHRQRASMPKKVRPKSLCASEPNQVWPWCIACLSTDIKGSYFYLYLIVGVYSRCVAPYDNYVDKHLYHQQGGVLAVYCSCRLMHWISCCMFAVF